MFAAAEVTAAPRDISTAAGGYTGDDGLAVNATLSSPRGIAFDASGNLVISDTANDRVRRVDASTGVITTIAGTGSAGFAGDRGPATEAQLEHPHGIAFDSAGNLYVAEWFNNRVRRVRPDTGVITTVVSGLGQLTDVVVDGSGDLFVAAPQNSRVLRVNPLTGAVFEAVGTGVSGSSGDGGAAIDAQLEFPSGLAFDEAGNLFIADSAANRVRRVDGSLGIISTLAGTGQYSVTGDGGLAIDATYGVPRACW